MQDICYALVYAIIYENNNMVRMFYACAHPRHIARDVIDKMAAGKGARLRRTTSSAAEGLTYSHITWLYYGSGHQEVYFSTSSWLLPTDRNELAIVTTYCDA